MIEYAPTIDQHQAERLLNDVLRPQVFTDLIPLNVAVHQCDSPIGYDAAISQDYRSVDLNFNWGPVWSTAWFRLRGEVPRTFANQDFRLLFDTGTEALCWWDGKPYQGVELHRQDVKLPASVRPGQSLEVFIEAACNHMLGIGPLYGDPGRIGDLARTQAGTLKQAHLACYHPHRAAMVNEFEMLLDLARSLPSDTSRARQLNRAIRQVCQAIRRDQFDVAIACARHIIGRMLDVAGEADRNTAHCIGHAHIDLAWLWPVRESKRKCARSFSTVLRYMERHPEYRFIQSQAQAYEWVREQYPDLFEQIKQRVATGQWEAGGAMWVEADCNVISGESLVRQILKGTRYWQQHFDVEQRYLWLPDVFGYSAALPQILKQSGLDAFFTQKISWNQFNKFPHHSFNWVGIDGTSIPAHFFPTDNYNSTNTPKELTHGDRNYKQAGSSPHFLQVFGYGDGGGGPTEPMIERIRRAPDTAGLPKTRFSRVDEFVDILVDDAPNLPEWVGELYLELHRGTYTTQARCKKFNRLGERLLQDVEFAQCLGGDTADERAELDRLWKLLLLNQFHDIIPGSSIQWVYDDALRDYKDILTSGNELLTRAMQRITPSDGAGEAATQADEAVLVLNSGSHDRDAVLCMPTDADSAGRSWQMNDGEHLTTQAVHDFDQRQQMLVQMRDVAPLSATLIAPSSKSAADHGTPPSRVRVDGLTLENELLKVRLNDEGQVTSLIHRPTGREAIKADEPANQLMLYEDFPADWDAWDIDIGYLGQGGPLDSPVECEIIEQGPVRVAIEFRRAIGKASECVQRVQVTAGLPYVEFHTQVNWRESHRLLRALHPVDIHADYATYEIQFGHVRRPNHFNTSWDYARFEVAAQRWMDLSETGFGVALLNDCKYGHSCHRHVMGLSLLRSPKSPDPEADMAVHEFRYALMPHDGFDAGAIVEAAEQLNQPLRVAPAQAPAQYFPQADTHQSPVASFAHLEGEHAPGVVIDTVKLAEDGDGIVLRLYEIRGGRGEANLVFDRPVSHVEETDLLERTTQTHEATGRVRLRFTPFQIRTVKVRLR
ncbi:alpha-mannosidase [Phycisphaerales bacterium AB-hyl4]|uniref:Alpha-mannosidase n=1 Tax=Natronomicrosphaera hydrolytica TaxID=3242702 RepID=A0ABV4U3E6_9BACT